MATFKFPFSCILLGSFFLLSFNFPTITNSHSIQTIATSAPMARRILSRTPANVIKQYLTPHNQLRAAVGQPPLAWSETLANFAMAWGNKRRKDCKMIHSNGNYGENIFRGSGKNWKPAVESQYYDRKSNRCFNNRDCLHYTQMVWKQILRVGCAKVICNSGSTFITCNYDPHGNVIGQRPF